MATNASYWILIYKLHAITIKNPIVHRIYCVWPNAIAIPHCVVFFTFLFFQHLSSFGPASPVSIETDEAITKISRKRQFWNLMSNSENEQMIYRHCSLVWCALQLLIDTRFSLFFGCHQLWAHAVRIGWDKKKGRDRGRCWGIHRIAFHDLNHFIEAQIVSSSIYSAGCTLMMNIANLIYVRLVMVGWMSH